MLPRQFDDTHRADDTAAMDQPWQRAVDRFCRQYLQLEQQLDFPQDAHLRLAEVQEAIYARLFAADSIPYKPPVRYMVRTLKALVSQIESSIEDWDEHVSFLPRPCRCHRSRKTKARSPVSHVMLWSLTRKVGSI